MLTSTSSASFAAVAVVAVGLLIVWSNPARWVNRLVFSCSLHIAIWLGFLHLALSSREGLVWLRCATSVSALIPLHFWFVKEAIAADFQESRLSLVKRMLGWVVATSALAVIPTTDYFIPSFSTGTHRVYGAGYYLYIAGVLGLYAALGLDSYQRMKSLVGGRRLALQVWLGGGCATAATILGLMAVNAMTHDSSYIRLQPLVVLVYYAGTSYAITTHRIFDARQLVLLGIEKAILVATVAGAAYVFDAILSIALPEPLAYLVTTGLSLWIAATLNEWLDGVFQFYPQAISARQAAFTAAQREAKEDRLEAAFKGVLKGWGQSDLVILLSGAEKVMSGGGIELPFDSPVVRVMRHLRWATPERLAREPATAERNEVGNFLSLHGLGVIVIAEGPALTAVIGVAVGASRRPYTYPQATQLLELASIMVGALERAHFAAKMQRTEQLATVGLVGASLAHEIRNPLVSIKTFVQLLPTHHQDPAFREKFFRLIGGEVERIDQLTEQLLDLSTPRTYNAVMLELHAVMRSSLDLVAAKAADKNVQFLTEFRAETDTVFTDPAAAKQVMLNLCFNAIQAVESRGEGERWIKVGTRKTKEGVEMAVSDSGLGIAPEMQQRLFQPFQTTKSTGFGLGLAICRDILANLQASISVDPPVPGQGATFRVTYPCQPSSS